jgi:hypothetical protein
MERSECRINQIEITQRKKAMEREDGRSKYSICHFRKNVTVFCNTVISQKNAPEEELHLRRETQKNKRTVSSSADEEGLHDAE